MEGYNGTEWIKERRKERVGLWCKDIEEIFSLRNKIYVLDK
jgi:hypothetical protein